MPGFTLGLHCLQSTEISLQRQRILDSALPELYAAIIVFAAKARTYFEAKGIYLWSSGVIQYLIALC